MTVVALAVDGVWQTNNIFVDNADARCGSARCSWLTYYGGLYIGLEGRPFDSSSFFRPIILMNSYSLAWVEISFAITLLHSKPVTSLSFLSLLSLSILLVTSFSIDNVYFSLSICPQLAIKESCFVRHLGMEARYRLWDYRQRQTLCWFQVVKNTPGRPQARVLWRLEDKHTPARKQIPDNRWISKFRSLM